jgi:hypothetical protein
VVGISIFSDIGGGISLVAVCAFFYNETVFSVAWASILACRVLSIHDQFYSFVQIEMAG